MDTKEVKNLVIYFVTLDKIVSCPTIFIMKHDSVLDLTQECLFTRKNQRAFSLK